MTMLNGKMKEEKKEERRITNIIGACITALSMKPDLWFLTMELHHAAKDFYQGNDFPGKGEFVNILKKQDHPAIMVGYCGSTIYKYDKKEQWR